jgi:phage terminase large subunit
MFQQTTALKKIVKLNKKIRAVQGGTSAGKTIAILLLLIQQCQTDKEPTLTSVVAESIPHLKRGALRDFMNIMKGHNYFKEDRWSATDRTYTFETGSQMEFFSSDDGSKLRGARRDHLFMNEANKQSLEAFNELEVRTKGNVFLDWNPTNEFWFYTEVQPNRKDVDYIIVTYVDNEGLPEEIVKSIEARRHNKSWWKVYGEGQLGEVEGRIYVGWNQLDELPSEARLVSIGMDFGYTNDPSAIVAMYYHNGAYVLDEIAYRKGLSNKALSDYINSYLVSEGKSVVTVADSAEPKSIDEIRLYGTPIVPSVKGPGSVNQGIQFVQDQKIFVTKRSVNVWKEYNNFLWKVDRLGSKLNVPDHAYSHSMDAIRYGFDNIRPRPQRNTPLQRPNMALNQAI